MPTPSERSPGPDHEPLETILQSRGIHSLDALIILGSGMSGCFLPEEYEVVAERGGSSVMGHSGRLALLGKGRNRILLALGRRHLYEGYRLHEITWIVRQAASLGARRLIVSNAAGGLNPSFRAGDVMLIDDYLAAPLGGAQALGWKHAPERDAEIIPFSSSHRDGPFDTGLYPEIERGALQEGIPLRRGVYAGVTGPSYETRAEIRALRRMGADAVGMSTIAETAAALSLGMRVTGLSLITNVLTDSARVTLDHLDVVEQGKLAEQRMRKALDVAMEAVLT